MLTGSSPVLTNSPKGKIKELPINNPSERSALPRRVSNLAKAHSPSLRGSPVLGGKNSSPSSPASPTTRFLSSPDLASSGSSPNNGSAVFSLDSVSSNSSPDPSPLPWRVRRVLSQDFGRNSPSSPLSEPLILEDKGSYVPQPPLKKAKQHSVSEACLPPFYKEPSDAEKEEVLTEWAGRKEAGILNRIKGTFNNTPNDEGYPPLYYGVIKQKPAFVSWCMNTCHSNPDVVHKVPPRVTVTEDTDGKTPIQWAIQHDLPEVVHALLGGKNLNEPLKALNGQTPLYAATVAGSQGVMQFLVRHGADPYAQNANGESPLLRAINHDCIDLIPILLNRTDKSFRGKGPLISLNVAPKDGHPPLWHAAQRGSEAMVRCLMDWGADPACVGEDGQTPVWVAANRGDEDILKAVLENHTSLLNTPDRHGHTPLDVGSRHPAIKTLLESKGALSGQTEPILPPPARPSSASLGVASPISSPVISSPLPIRHMFSDIEQRKWHDEIKPIIECLHAYTFSPSFNYSASFDKHIKDGILESHSDAPILKDIFSAFPLRELEFIPLPFTYRKGDPLQKAKDLANIQFGIRWLNDHGWPLKFNEDIIKDPVRIVITPLVPPSPSPSLSEDRVTPPPSPREVFTPSSRRRPVTQPAAPDKLLGRFERWVASAGSFFSAPETPPPVGNSPPPGGIGSELPDGYAFKTPKIERFTMGPQLSSGTEVPGEDGISPPLTPQPSSIRLTSPPPFLGHSFSRFSWSGSLGRAISGILTDPELPAEVPPSPSSTPSRWKLALPFPFSKSAEEVVPPVLMTAPIEENAQLLSPPPRPMDGTFSNSGTESSSNTATDTTPSTKPGFIPPLGPSKSSSYTTISAPYPFGASESIPNPDTPVFSTGAGTGTHKNPPIFQDPKALGSGAGETTSPPLPAEAGTLVYPTQPILTASTSVGAHASQVLQPSTSASTTTIILPSPTKKDQRPRANSDPGKTSVRSSATSVKSRITLFESPPKGPDHKVHQTPSKGDLITARRWIDIQKIVEGVRTGYSFHEWGGDDSCQLYTKENWGRYEADFGKRNNNYKDLVKSFPLEEFRDIPKPEDFIKMRAISSKRGSLNLDQQKAALDTIIRLIEWLNTNDAPLKFNPALIPRHLRYKFPDLFPPDPVGALKIYKASSPAPHDKDDRLNNLHELLIETFRSTAPQYVTVYLNSSPAQIAVILEEMDRQTPELAVVTEDSTKKLFERIILELSGKNRMVAPPIPPAPPEDILEPSKDPQLDVETRKAATKPKATVFLPDDSSDDDTFDPFNLTLNGKNSRTPTPPPSPTPLTNKPAPTETLLDPSVDPDSPQVRRPTTPKRPIGNTLTADDSSDDDTFDPFNLTLNGKNSRTPTPPPSPTPLTNKPAPTETLLDPSADPDSPQTKHPTTPKKPTVKNLTEDDSSDEEENTNPASPFSPFVVNLHRQNAPVSPPPSPPPSPSPEIESRTPTTRRPGKKLEEDQDDPDPMPLLRNLQTMPSAQHAGTVPGAMGTAAGATAGMSDPQKTPQNNSIPQVDTTTLPYTKALPGAQPPTQRFYYILFMATLQNILNSVKTGMHTKNGVEAVLNRGYKVFNAKHPGVLPHNFVANVMSRLFPRHGTRIMASNDEIASVIRDVFPTDMNLDQVYDLHYKSLITPIAA
jgi:ankyrin repeat protein